eukprot:GHVH01011820.1.p1 GENE.GHVH01011820.1~~GHVH01011820.1.p1  ORF type:complete len:365 (+),score=61.85 GHVH01011820.1:47-1141(+)
MLNLPVGQKRLTNVAQVKFKAGKQTFTLACYRNKVVAWRLGQEHNIDEVLQIDDIFTNVNRGEVANEGDLQKAFKGETKEGRIRMILDHGVLQVTDEEREVLDAETFKKVAQFVADRVLESTTGSRMSLEAIEEELKLLGFAVKWTMDYKRQGLKAIQLLEAPRDGAAHVVRSWYKVQVTFTDSTAQELINNKQNPVTMKLEDLQGHSRVAHVVADDSKLTFVVHPGDYGCLSSLVLKEVPTSRSVIIASDVNPVEVQKPVLRILVPENNSSSLFSSTAQPLFPSKAGILDEDVNSNAKECIVCGKIDKVNGSFRGDNSNQLYRSHMRSDWHNFNMKRQSAMAEPIDLELYEAMIDQLGESDSS